MTYRIGIIHCRLLSHDAVSNNETSVKTSNSIIRHNSGERPPKRRKTTRVEEATSTAVANCVTAVATAPAPVIGKLSYSRLRLPGRPRSRLQCRADPLFTSTLVRRANAVPIVPVIGVIPHEEEADLVTQQHSGDVVPSVLLESPSDCEMPSISRISSMPTNDAVPIASTTLLPRVNNVATEIRRTKSSLPVSWPIIDPVVDAVNMDHAYAMQGVTRVTEAMMPRSAHYDSLMHGVVARLTVIRPKIVTAPIEPIAPSAVTQTNSVSQKSVSVSKVAQKSLLLPELVAVSAVTRGNRNRVSDGVTVTRQSPRDIKFSGEMEVTADILRSCGSNISPTVDICQRVNLVTVRKSGHQECCAADELQSASPTKASSRLVKPNDKCLPVAAAQLLGRGHVECAVISIADFEPAHCGDSDALHCGPSVAYNQPSSNSFTSCTSSSILSQSASSLLSVCDNRLQMTDGESVSVVNISQSDIPQQRKFPLQVKVYCVRPKDSASAELGNNNNLTRSLKTIVRKFAFDSLNEPVCGVITSADLPNDRTQSCVTGSSRSVSSCNRVIVTPSLWNDSSENGSQTPIAEIIISDDSNDCC